MRAGAADGAGVGGHRAELEAQAREDARVGVVHVAVFALQVLVVGVERVAVLHHELAPAHDAEARAALVAELGLDLVEVHRQAPVALQFRARELGDGFLRGGLEHEIALVAILEAQQLRPVRLPAARLLPQLGGLHHRHAELERAGAVHLLAHDRRHLVQHAHAERQPGVDARGDAPDDAGAQHQAVADDLRFGRAFLLRREKELRSFHSSHTAVVFVGGLWKNRSRHSN